MQRGKNVPELRAPLQGLVSVCVSHSQPEARARRRREESFLLGHDTETQALDPGRS